MGELELDGITQAREIPITTLDAVPIEPACLQIMLRILTQHGARLTETGAAPPQNIEQTARMYRVTFPPGTTRVNGLRMQQSVPFVISYPDGYVQHGTELWPATLRMDDPHINALYFTATEVKQ
jgi:hypothetical protein